MTLSKSEYPIGLFDILRIFYPPKGRLLADSRGVQLFFTYALIQLGNVCITFKIRILHRPF